MAAANRAENTTRIPPALSIRHQGRAHAYPGPYGRNDHLRACGLALLTFTALEILLARKLIAQGGTFTADGDKVTVLEVGKESVAAESFLLSEVERAKYDDNGNEHDIWLEGRSYTLRGAYFEDAEQFESFREIFSK